MISSTAIQLWAVCVVPLPLGGYVAFVILTLGDVTTHYHPPHLH